LASWPGGNTRFSIDALERQCLAFLQRVRVVQAADEEQVGDLLDHLHRVGDAAGPEGIPDGIDLAAEFAGEHAGVSISKVSSGVDDDGYSRLRSHLLGNWLQRDQLGLEGRAVLSAIGRGDFGCAAAAKRRRREGLRRRRVRQNEMGAPILGLIRHGWTSALCFVPALH
jgi:hypothetical protein